MSALHFPHLFSPFTIRGMTLRNRIMSTGHETGIVDATGINDALVAYHRARAAGGAGLIVIEVASVHSSATFVRNSIKLYRDEAIPGYRRLADAAHENGAVLFAQLFHPGREILESIDGSAPPSWAPSAVPNERFHVMPAPMPRSLVHEVISGYGDAAYRLQRAGVDGCEILCSMGYLLAQFLNPRVNLRTDEYGGSDENRLRIVREILHDIRAKVGDEMVVGIRISGDELSPEGLGARGSALDLCRARRRSGARLLQRHRRHLHDPRRVGAHRAADDGGQRLPRPLRGGGEGAGHQAGLRGRAHQPAPAGGGDRRMPVRPTCAA